MIIIYFCECQHTPINDSSFRKSFCMTGDLPNLIQLNHINGLELFIHSP